MPEFPKIGYTRVSKREPREHAIVNQHKKGIMHFSHLPRVSWERRECRIEVCGNASRKHLIHYHSNAKEADKQ